MNTLIPTQKENDIKLSPIKRYIETNIQQMMRSAMNLRQYLLQSIQLNLIQALPHLGWQAVDDSIGKRIVHLLMHGLKPLYALLKVVGLLILGASKVYAETYSFGIVPQQAASELARSWTPFLHFIEKSTGISLRFKTAPSIPEFERRLALGEYDFAYMNPYHYTVFSVTPGYQAFAKEKGVRLQGLIVVKSDSDIQTIEQLKDQDLAFPAPASFAASVLPRAQLNRLNISFKPHYVTSHDSVYHAVARGIYPGGGGVTRTLNNAPQELRDQLRVIWRTESITPHAFAVHPRVPAEIVQRLTQALIDMKDSQVHKLERVNLGELGNQEAMVLLKKLGLSGFEAARDADWDDVRRISFDKASAPIAQGDKD